jgi:hypothetical protein
MSKHKYLSRTTVDIIWQDEDLILDVDILSIGNTGIGSYECHGTRGYDKGRDYVEDWSVRMIRDAHGDPLPKDEQDRLALEIEGDDAMIEYIQTDLDERLSDMADIDYDERDDV